MTIIAGLCVAILVLSSFVVGTKTLAMWFRTRGVPELLLSTLLLSEVVIGYPLAIASSRIPSTEMWPIHVAKHVFLSVGFGSLLLFTLQVFRPRVRWAQWLTGSALLLLVVATILTSVEDMSDHPRHASERLGISTLNAVPIAVAYFWTAIESLSYYGRLRRRLRLGLAEGIVVNRLLLWGLMASATGAAIIVNLLSLLTGNFMSPLVITISSGLALTQAVALYLAFHAPAWYTDWLRQKHSEES